MSESVTYDLSAAENLSTKAGKALKSVVDIVIEDRVEYELYADNLRSIKTQLKALEEKRKEIVDPMNIATKKINDFFRVPREKWQSAENKIKQAMLVYTKEQQKIEEDKRLKAESNAQADRERLSAEADKKREKSRKLLEEAQTISDDGDDGSAEDLLQESRDLEVEADIAEKGSGMVMAAVVTTEKVAGISSRKTYSADVRDLLALAKAVGAGKVPIEAIVANDKFLNGQARAFKKTGPLYPGVFIRCEEGVTARIK